MRRLSAFLVFLPLLSLSLAVPAQAASSAPVSNSATSTADMSTNSQTEESSVDERPPGLYLLTKQTPTLAAGTASWVAPMWEATCDVKDFSAVVQLTYPSASFGFNYPTTRGGKDTSFYQESSLNKNMRDFTAIRLSVPSFTTSFKLQLKTSFTCDGVAAQNVYEIAVPVSPSDFNVTGYTLDNPAFTLPAGTNRFLSQKVTAGSFDLQSFRARVTKLPEGAKVYYPSDKTFAFLNKTVTLSAATSDFFSYRLDVSSLPVGDYSFTYEITYRSDKDRVSLVEVPFSIVKSDTSQ